MQLETQYPNSMSCICRAVCQAQGGDKYQLLRSVHAFDLLNLEPSSACGAQDPCRTWGTSLSLGCTAASPRHTMLRLANTMVFMAGMLRHVQILPDTVVWGVTELKL